MSSNEKNDVRRGKKKKKVGAAHIYRTTLGKIKTSCTLKSPGDRLDSHSWTLMQIGQLSFESSPPELPWSDKTWCGAEDTNGFNVVTLYMWKIKVAPFRGITCSRYTYPPLQTLDLKSPQERDSDEASARLYLPLRPFGGGGERSTAAANKV